MSRALAFVSAVLCALLAVSSACIAYPIDPIHFSLERESGDGSRIHASFRNYGDRREHNEWSSGFLPSELAGLEVSSFLAAGARPVHFAIVREAGRLDCAGSGGSGAASGTCSFTENPGFTQLLESRGIGRPNAEQAFGLMAVNARREVIDAVAAAHYPAPTIDNLVALSALGVDGRYITEMAQAGYRPQSVGKLVEFKALGITPAWIGGFVRVGYANVPGDGLVQLKALGITPDYIEGYQRIGYRNLPVETLVQLKALNITPEFVRTVAQPGAPMPPVNQLVQLKMFGRGR